MRCGFTGTLALFALMLALVGTTTARAQDGLPPGGTPVLPPDALLTTPVGGLEVTRASAQVVPVAAAPGVGRVPFTRALRVTIGAAAPETNATQLTLSNAAPVTKGDALLASFYVRGASATGATPAQAELLFEKATAPWTKSVTRGATAPRDRNRWKRVLVPFTAAETYQPGEAMVSLRFAFGPQTIEVGGLTVLNYARGKTADELVAVAAEANLLGAATVAVNLADTRQTLRGFGGNFAQPRYGASVPMDPVGQYNLDNLRVVHARVGIPLNHWTPEKGVYKDEGPARAALLQMQMMAKRKIPITGSVWEGPLWMLPGTPEQGRVLSPDRYDDCIEAIGRFLVTARDRYGATVTYFSFNEPDYGVNFKFTPAQMADFIRKAGPRWAALGLKTKFLTADTANGGNFADYARPLLADRTIAPYLGPLAFHSWDALSATEARYAAIAALGRQYKKPVWCTEAGHDAQLWQASDPWKPWENALRTALAYARTLRLTGAEQMDYWTYQDNYPLVSKDGMSPFPVWHVLRQMEEALSPGSRVATATVNQDDLTVLPTAGPKKGQFSVLLVNPIGAGSVALSGLPKNAAVSVVQSTSGAPGQRILSPRRTDAMGRITLPLPARSVVTVRGAAAPR